MVSGEMLSEKEILLELRQDVKHLSEGVAVLTSQDLHNRVRAIEDWKSQMVGAMKSLRVGVAMIVGILTILTIIVGWSVFFRVPGA